MQNESGIITKFKFEAKTISGPGFTQKVIHRSQKDVDN
jgi:hypothetical protein